VTNYLGVGSGVGTGVRSNNFSGVDFGVDFLLSVFFCLSFLHSYRASLIKGAHIISEKKTQGESQYQLFWLMIWMSASIS
jgi:hypothetical protein